MLINDFDTWKALKIKHTPDDCIVKCPVCLGEGCIEDECKCCKNTSEHVCGLCEGDGSLKFSELPSDKVSMLFSKKTYHREIIADLEKLASWKGKKGNDRIEFFLEHGYSIYTLMANKVEKVASTPIIGV